MSQHADICNAVIPREIARGSTREETLSCVNAVLEVLEYDDKFLLNSEDLKRHAEYLLTQKDFLYGVSHAQIQKFLNIGPTFK